MKLLLTVQNKVSGVTFKAGPSTEELQIVDVMEIESRFAGWLHASLPRNINLNVISIWMGLKQWLCLKI